MEQTDFSLHPFGSWRYFVTQISKRQMGDILGRAIKKFQSMFIYPYFSAKLQCWRAVECEFKLAILICKPITITR
jgi:hypothetical protein